MVSEGLGKWDELFYKRNIMKVLFLIREKQGKNMYRELKHYQMIYVLGGMKKEEFQRIKSDLTTTISYKERE